jgi:hypothetical protein
MLEMYIVSALGALGYTLNNLSCDYKTNNNKKINKNELPSMNNIYDSKRIDTVRNRTSQKAANVYKKSLDPRNTGVINKNYQFIGNDNNSIKDNKIKSLTGQYLDENDFSHNNMVPFFGSGVKQNMSDRINQSKLENFTGVNPYQIEKCEVAPFYDHVKQDIRGAQNTNDFYQDRIDIPKARNNEFPLPAVQVGPGLNQGYTATPTGGFQQDTREFEFDRGVDELRVKTNPKMIYEGRIIDGMKEDKRGKIGELAKNRVETYYEQTPDMLLTTTGAVIKAKEIPEFIINTQNRQTTQKEHIGTAYGQDQQAPTSHPNVRESTRNITRNFGLGPAHAADKGKGNSDDFGKSKILVYDNERDITTTRVYTGNLTHLVKSMIAPITDMLSTTKKDEAVDNPRHYGNISAGTNLLKATVYDPNDIARTTIKEQLIHDGTNGNLTGPVQLYVYDPDEIAKTTVRETLKNTNFNTNMSTHAYKGQAYDPNDKLRTTNKEQLVDREREFGNIDGVEKDGIYDDNYEAKTTWKQFLSDYERYGDAFRDSGTGYLTNEISAPNTQKQFTSDIEYIGGGNAKDKKDMATDNFSNADISDRQESILRERLPTYTGPKSTQNCINVKTNKNICESLNPRELYNSDRTQTGLPAPIDNNNLTKGGKDLETLIDIRDRLDVSTLDSLKHNPYVLNITK